MSLGLSPPFKWLCCFCMTKENNLSSNNLNCQTSTFKLYNLDYNLNYNLDYNINYNPYYTIYKLKETVPIPPSVPDWPVPRNVTVWCTYLQCKPTKTTYAPAAAFATGSVADGNCHRSTVGQAATQKRWFRHVGWPSVDAPYVSRHACCCDGRVVVRQGGARARIRNRPKRHSECVCVGGGHRVVVVIVSSTCGQGLNPNRHLVLCISTRDPAAIQVNISVSVCVSAWGIQHYFAVFHTPTTYSSGQESSLQILATTVSIFVSEQIASSKSLSFFD
jgi:hypothetical protein